MSIDELTEDVTFYARLLQQEKRYETNRQGTPCHNYWSQARLCYENELSRQYDTSVGELRTMAANVHYTNEAKKARERE